MNNCYDIISFNRILFICGEGFIKLVSNNLITEPRGVKNVEKKGINL